jgi:hypothetical protein
MRPRPSLAFSTGQTTARVSRRVRPPWRCRARIQVFRPQGGALRSLGYIPLHALIPFAGIIVWHRAHPAAFGDLHASQCPRRISQYTLTRWYTLARPEDETRLSQLESER